MAARSCTIGYPRIGPNREMKKALESYWKGASSLEEFQEASAGVQRSAWQAQLDAGIDLIGLDGTEYDQVLDMGWTLGLVPLRFQHLTGYERYFAMARGAADTPALDMSKYFNTNYHYLVPEVTEATRPLLNAAKLLEKIERGQSVVGRERAVPMIIGPVTMARLAKLSGTDVASVVKLLVPVYADLLGRIKALQVPEVQVLEPALCFEDADTLRPLFEDAYAALSATVPLNLVTFYDDLGAAYPWAVQLPVAAVSIDFVGVIGAAIPCQSLELLKRHGFPAGKRLGAGVIDGRNVWADTGAAALLEQIKAAGVTDLTIQTSCSLQHVPIDCARESKLAPDVRARLAFAQQKLSELVELSKGVGAAGAKAPPAPAAPRVPEINPGMFDRPAPYEERRQAQFKVNSKIPSFPTTTIGSFPQTKAIRKARADLKAGRLSEAEYQKQMDNFIVHIIGVQEGLGLDVLVHGEPERSDMVEYFGLLLEGFAFTEHGWVQSYGSRYVRPPVIHGDVSRGAPMTVREFRVAQALTELPVKGMLTGPVTMLNWAFPRADVPRSATAFQLALALREEVADLERAGCTIIQVDEPALREGLPLKREQWDSYLHWSVDAFRLTCAVAGAGTQIVTHLCYSEFADILPSIDRMDADVLTIENSRSGNEMIVALRRAGYARDIGAGVYDVHSPVVPSVPFLTDKLSSFLDTEILGRDPARIWVNPDCGLKTRGWEEVLPALRNMVQAAQIMRRACKVDEPSKPSKDQFSMEEMRSTVRAYCACCV